MKEISDLIKKERAFLDKYTYNTLNINGYIFNKYIG